VEYIRYAVTGVPKESQLHLRVNWETNDQRWRRGGIPLFRARDYLLRERILWLEQKGSLVNYSFDIARIGRRLKPESHYRDVQAVARVLGIVGSYHTLDMGCPNLAISIGMRPLPDGQRYGMGAEVRWPAEEAGLLQEVATETMRTVASDLNYMRDVVSSRKSYRGLIRDIVGAVASREKGVSVIAHSMGSSTLDTDGNRYKPEAPTYELHPHNIYNHEQQLIIYAGCAVLEGLQRLD
jgi:hypothetical protein